MWTDGPRCCCFFSSLLILDLPNPLEWLSSQQHGHLTTARGMTLTQRHKGGTSCPSVTHYNSFPHFFVLWTLFTGLLRALDFEWPVSPNNRTPPTKTCEPNTRRDIRSAHARIHTSLIYLPLAFTACMRACVRNTAHRWHYRNLLNNWKSEKAVTWKPYLRTSQVMTYKKIYIEKLIYFYK